ncbi:hypothetical protein [Flavivirga spongiicola]|uniref:DUF3857 domain-containing protein n=1 Tax=Flavivirga spongiicola TaxID=421621 RepID=A0ABU7XMY4_9FLAO|nr:hypothetical protein [Flavivirga sp. MEBiC05379]MDO5981472.1 hypothetical protein [Flavivirga sp. MEBiC05379]
MKTKTIIYSIGFLVFTSQLFAGVKYDEGRVQIDGIQLLQDSEDDNAYYYLTRFVKLSQKEDGTYEFLCIKYIGEGEQASGGIFHALVEFSLPQDIIDEIEAKLKTRIGENARIVGPVPMRQFTKEGQSDIGKFDVVSSILNNTEGEQAFTTNVLTSGFAPLLPNSKAAIAAKLTPSGTTLLWESLQGATSDVSVSVHGYYEAVVKGYNATISAEASTIYEHYSRISNVQSGYTKSEVRRVADQMIQDQIINVDVFDRSEGLGIDTKDMQGITDIVTEKLIELMFDTQTGWAKKPETEVAVEAGQIKGRQDRGWFASVFGGKDDTEYYTDNQYVRKKREDIKINKFYLNLSKSTTIKVPVHTSGNIGGIYNLMKDNDRYFRVVNLADSDFQKRTVHFQIDGGYTDAFNDILNSVSIAFRKTYNDGNDAATSDLLFTPNDIKEGKDFKQVAYPRLGITGSEWMDYEYKISWNVKGEPVPIEIPKAKDVWSVDNASLVALVPPFKKKVVDIDADRPAFKDSGVRTATVRFFVILNGKATSQRTIILRESDAENTLKIALYHDPEEPLAYQVTWYGKHGKYAEEIKQLKEDYLFLMTPTEDDFEN